MLAGEPLATDMRYDPSKPIVPGQATTPQAAVQGFLQAVAAGNADDALSFHPSLVTGDVSFLTDDVLAASNAINPITEIVATLRLDGSKETALVDASYRLGSTAVETTYEVIEKDGYYFAVDVFGRVSMGAFSGPRGDINGLPWPAKSATFKMFPGTYRISIDNPLLVLTSDDTFTVTGHEEFEVPWFTTELAPGATEIVTKAAAAKLRGCLKERELFTSCGFGADRFKYNGKTVTPKMSTLRWQFDGKEPKFPAPRQYLQSHQTVYFRDLKIKIALTFTGTNGNGYKAKFEVDRVEVRITDPDDLKFSFLVY